MSNSDFQTICLERQDGVATVTLNRPKSLNALSIQLVNELRRAISDVAQNEQDKVLIITGAGRGFCAGADLRDLLELVEQKDPDERAGDTIAGMMYSTHNRLINDLYEFPKPVVTAVNGIAAGGGLGLSLSADIVLAGKSASFSSVFANQLGIAPDMGTSHHLQRLVGRARAMRMAFLGERIKADIAMEWGLVAEVVDDNELRTRAMDVARQLTRQAAKVYVRTRQGLSRAEHSTMASQLAWEAEAQRELCSEPAFARQVDEFSANRKAG